MPRTPRPDVDLFAPSLQEAERITLPPPGLRPWRIGSQFYVAFFGGALAVAALAWVNAGRLGADDSVRRAIVALGAAGVVVSVGVSYALYGGDFSAAFRIGYRIVGVVLAGALYKVQQSADRVYSFRSPLPADEEYDSMLGPGLLATFVGGIAQLALVFGGMAILDGIIG